MNCEGSECYVLESCKRECSLPNAQCDAACAPVQMNAPHQCAGSQNIDGKCVSSAGNLADFAYSEKTVELPTTTEKDIRVVQSTPEKPLPAQPRA